ncbi:E3 ubiquitin-protein ligase RNF217 [Echeneis naucrates]|uniref:E3 ubiquitin-protein ligase RNF217 n=1 Tax=Echeneis naucrates TaxID=173247 RepID=A0A665V9V7_ECHNA|nr:probable E3 ubiquitin-protein ligase RNF217 [Echeneis naucrates]
MGRDKPGMEDDGPVTDACEMPGFISSFEEGKAKLSRNLSTETSFVDAKVERPVRDLNRRVTGSDSAAGGEGEPGEPGQRDAEGNNNNNCNGGGERRRRASAVEILRRNLAVTKSPSLCLNTDSRMQRQAERDTRRNSDVTHRHGREWGRETDEAAAQNEPTLHGVTSPDAPVAQCHRVCDSDSNESSGVKEHVYCTVYCIAGDSRPKDGQTTHRHDEAVPSDAPELDPETEREAGSSPEPALYTVDDLVDPFGDIYHQLYRDQHGAESVIHSCRVCLEDKTIAPLPCCRKAVCDECLKFYVSSQVRVGKPYISCPIPECSGSLDDGMVISHLANEDLAKYRYFLELNQLDSSTKPCPQCSHFTSLKKHNPNHSEHKYKIQCSNCQFVWCFKCHAPWHNGLKCRDYRKGDKLLRTWASVIEHGQRNAQKCPQCKIHIQRTEGCDHMTCAQCNTNFCYRCGERYRHLRFFGDHTSNLSVFGCKYRYLPDKPHLRRLIRGSVCATKVLIAPVVILLVVVLGALALVIGLVVFPVYYVCKRRKKQRTQGSGRWI